MIVFQSQLCLYKILKPLTVALGNGSLYNYEAYPNPASEKPGTGLNSVLS